jgi:YbbR domain-containing protein
MRYRPFRHFGLKVLAIALAVLLWLTVAGEHTVERSLRVPLEFRNVPPALEIVGNAPDNVDVRVRGSSALLSRLQAGEIVAVLDLGSARSGSRLFHIRNDEVRAPFGVEVTQVLPATLGIDLERSTRRTVPVKPALDGEPAAGYVVGRVSSEPATVDIVGPETRVKQITDATTEPVSVTGARTRVRDVLTIGISDASVRLVQPQAATVIVEISPAPIERELKAVPVRWKNLGADLHAQVTPSVVRVTVRGAREALNALTSDGVRTFVDLAGLGPGRYNLRIQVEPAENFGTTSIEPATVTVAVR